MEHVPNHQSNTYWWFVYIHHGYVLILSWLTYTTTASCTAEFRRYHPVKNHHFAGAPDGGPPSHSWFSIKKHQHRSHQHVVIPQHSVPYKTRVIAWFLSLFYPLLEFNGLVFQGKLKLVCSPHDLQGDIDGFWFLGFSHQSMNWAVLPPVMSSFHR